MVHSRPENALLPDNIIPIYITQVSRVGRYRVSVTYYGEIRSYSHNSRRSERFWTRCRGRKKELFARTSGVVYNVKGTSVEQRPLFVMVVHDRMMVFYVEFGWNSTAATRPKIDQNLVSQ